MLPQSRRLQCHSPIDRLQWGTPQGQVQQCKCLPGPQCPQTPHRSAGLAPHPEGSGQCLTVGRGTSLRKALQCTLMVGLVGWWYKPGKV